MKKDVLKPDVLKPDVLKPDVLWVYHFVADSDPTFHFDADPDLDSNPPQVLHMLENEKKFVEFHSNASLSLLFLVHHCHRCQTISRDNIFNFLEKNLALHLFGIDSIQDSAQIRIRQK